MNSEAPELLFVQLTPMGGTISYLSAPPDNRKPIYQYRRVDPPAAPTKCVKCRHTLLEDCPLDEMGQCRVSLTTPNGDAYECGCKCEFTVTPAAPDERDKALALNIAKAFFGNRLPIIGGKPFASVHSNPTLNLADKIAAALATARAEVWRDAIGIVESALIGNRAMGVVRGRVVATLESARGKVEG